MTHEEILTTLGNYVDYLIAGSTAEAPLWNIKKVRSGKPNKWNYVDGCMITACLSLYKTTGDEKFLKFSAIFWTTLSRMAARSTPLTPTSITWTTSTRAKTCLPWLI